MAVTVEDEEGLVVGFAVLDVRTPSFGRSEKGGPCDFAKVCVSQSAGMDVKGMIFSPPAIYIPGAHSRGKFTLQQGNCQPATNPFAHRNLRPSYLNVQVILPHVLRNSSCTRT